jgi:hypothetical protein
MRTKKAMRIIKPVFARKFFEYIRCPFGRVDEAIDE